MPHLENCATTYTNQIQGLASDNRGRRVVTTATIVGGFSLIKNYLSLFGGCLFLIEISLKVKISARSPIIVFDKELLTWTRQIRQDE